MKKAVKNSCFTKGFTLIELLVVVLIIGILAAVALPQYQKAVEKTRIANALTVMNGIQKSMDVWLLENGGDPTGGRIYFLWVDGFTLPKANAAIEVRSVLDCTSNNSFGGLFCADGTFGYVASCFRNSCAIYAYRSRDSFDGEGDYTLEMDRSSSNIWEYYCYYYDDSGERACNTLKGQGNWQIVDGNE